MDLDRTARNNSSTGSVAVVDRVKIFRDSPSGNVRRGGGIEYLHRSPESRRRRRKGNPVPGGITGDLSLQVWGVSNLRQ
jgi:hypothetical protein